MNHTEDDQNILIVGAGAAGSTLACLLDAVGCQATLLVRPGRGPEDTRGIAVTADVRRILTYAGVWPLLDPAAIGAMRRIEIQDLQASALHFDASAMGRVALAHVVPHHVLMAALDQRLANATHVQLRAGELARAGWAADQVRATLTDGDTLNTPLLVGADGAGSVVRTLAGIPYQQQAYAESALTLTVNTAAPHEATAWQRFLPHGTLALLPLGAARERSVIWAVDEAAAAALLALDDTTFCQKLQEAAPACGACTVITPRRLFPLVRGQAARYIGPRVALVGDAAHQIHPMAGQGLNLGLEDAAALADVLTTDPHGDPGRTACLRTYERWRKAANLPVTQGIDWIRWAFRRQGLPWEALRSAGLRYTESQPWLKRGIMQVAAGLVGRRPLQSRRPRDHGSY